MRRARWRLGLTRGRHGGFDDPANLMAGNVQVSAEGAIMWGWLNTNANAIEAISAGLTVTVTAVLVKITAKYVRLTKTLVDVALAQSQAQDEALNARRWELQASVNFLSLAVGSLPDSSRRQQAEELRRGFTRWDDFDFGRFRMLAAELSPRAGGSAAAVEAKMQWLASQMVHANDSVDVGPLRSWVDEVLRQGEAAGLKAMSREFIGHVLAHSPKDKEDQAWPDRAVRGVIEALRSDEVDLGIRVERINMRGAYAKAMFEGGKQERAIAEEARRWAEKCAAWPRTQKLLNDTANYWEEDAKREDARARKERMRD